MSTAVDAAGLIIYQGHSRAKGQLVPCTSMGYGILAWYTGRGTQGATKLKLCNDGNNCLILFSGSAASKFAIMPRPRAATRALFEDTGTRRCGGKFNVFVCKRCGVEILENAYRFAVHLSVCKKATDEDRQLAQQQLSKSKKTTVGASPRSSVPGDIDIFGTGSGVSASRQEQSYGYRHRNSDFTAYSGHYARCSDTFARECEPLLCLERPTGEFANQHPAKLHQK
eukprot:scaffold390699_cov42-Prasinocladus_malaysianus.AAC.1